MIELSKPRIMKRGIKLQAKVVPHKLLVRKGTQPQHLKNTPSSASRVEVVESVRAGYALAATHEILTLLVMS